MQEFKKIVHIGTQPEYNRRGTELIPAKVFCKIEVKQKAALGLELSISGVIAPLSNGDCLGSCGQIYDGIAVDNFAAGWDKDKLAKFIAIWREWHLNDMRSYTPDMKQAGWDKLASKEIFKYSFWMTDENRLKAEQLKETALLHTLEGEIFNLSSEDKRLLKSETYKDVYGYELPQAPEFMELQTDYKTKQHKIERKTLGWVAVKEHKDGLLGRELNGLKYGHAWYFDIIPSEVLEWLQALPETQITPAWI